MFNYHLNSPKVCVCVVTYNQVNYIGECLESLINQVVNFPFEILVADDCSIDGTSDVVNDFASNYSNLIHIRHPINIGPSRNNLFIHNLAYSHNPTYVAHMDGDDLALPNKLEAQVKILDNNPNVSLSAHAVRVIGLSKSIGNEDSLPEFASTEQLLKLGTYFVNSSIMYRAKNPFNLINNHDVVDFYLYIEQSTFGQIHLNKNVLGCYRHNIRGVSKNLIQRKMLLNAYEKAFDHALELGISPHLVERSRMNRRMSFAISFFLDNELNQYIETIKIPTKLWTYASIKHKLLHYIRFIPLLLRFYIKIRKTFNCPVN